MFTVASFRMVGRCTLAAGLFIVLALIVVSIHTALAARPGNSHFQRTWQRTDQPVLDGQVSRTWMWGPQADTNVLEEPYSDAPGGSRDVQYFDKSRMEDNGYRADGAPWDVTNGLLVVELISGNLQVGDAEFDQRQPAALNVAGDPDPSTGSGQANGPTYATFGSLLNAAPLELGSTIIQRVDRDATVNDDPALIGQGVTVGFVDEVTNHAIAQPFWTFMNASGAVYKDGQVVTDQIFENPFFATGRPVTEAYWANIKVAGTYRDVLMQCFERRCLTYTPGNPEGFVVEAGNVGRHYFTWRYGQEPGDEPTSTPTATAPVTVTPTAPSTATATAPGTPSPTASPTPVDQRVRDYEFHSQWGKPYEPTQPFEFPRSIAVDADGDFWVVDYVKDNIVLFDKYGRFVRSVGSRGTGDGQFFEPIDAAVSADGKAYVLDRRNHRVQVFDGDGSFLAKWGVNGEFSYPSGIASHGDRVYVADSRNHRIQFFTLNGGYLGQFGSKGAGNGQFDHPLDVAIDPQGNVYVADTDNNRVQKFTPDGQYLGQFGSKGESNGQFNTVISVEVDAQGNVYTSEYVGNRIQKFDASGNYLTRWDTVGEFAGGEFAGEHRGVLRLQQQEPRSARCGLEPVAPQ